MDQRNQLHGVKELIIPNSTNFSKRARLRECFRKIKREVCHPTECSTRRHSSTQCFHHFRRWKNPQQSYRLLGSVPPLHDEVFLSQKRGPREREYSNDLQKPVHVGKLKHADPDRYQMGNMMLKWFFEHKSRENKDETKREFEYEQDDSKDNSSTSIPVCLESPSTLKNGIEDFSILNSEKYDSGHDHSFQNDQVNSRIVGDLISRIDDLLSETL